MTSIRHLLLLGMLSLFIRPCAAGVTSDEWQTVAPSVVGLDQNMLETLVGKIRHGEFSNSCLREWRPKDLAGSVGQPRGGG